MLLLANLIKRSRMSEGTDIGVEFNSLKMTFASRKAYNMPTGTLRNAFIIYYQISYDRHTV